MQVDSFDHRTLQYFHDTLAAHFRLLYASRCVPQIPGLLDDLTDEERALRLWREFYQEEIERLFREVPDLSRLILIAAVYPNPDKRGIEAEDQLYKRISDLYPELRCQYDKLHEKCRAQEEQQEKPQENRGQASDCDYLV